MKKIISFALALALSFCLCGCNDNGGSGRLPSPLDGVVAPDNTPKVETTEYLMISKITVSRSKNPYYQEFFYSADGVLTKESYVDIDSKGVTLFTYNAKGQLTEARTQRNLDHGTGDFSPIHTLSYTYDEKGLVKSITVVDEPELGDPIKTVFRYRYTENGAVDYIVQYDGEDNIAAKHVFEYGENGKIAKRTTLVDDKADTTATYDYDRNGRLCLELYNDSKGAEIGKVEFTYGDNGYVAKKVTSGNLFGKTESTYDYTEKEIPTASVQAVDKNQADIFFDIYGFHYGI